MLDIVWTGSGHNLTMFSGADTSYILVFLIMSIGVCQAIPLAAPVHLDLPRSLLHLFSSVAQTFLPPLNPKYSYLRTSSSCTILPGQAILTSMHSPHLSNGARRFPLRLAARSPQNSRPPIQHTPTTTPRPAHNKQELAAL